MQLTYGSHFQLILLNYACFVTLILNLTNMNSVMLDVFYLHWIGLDFFKLIPLTYV